MDQRPFARAPAGSVVGGLSVAVVAISTAALGVRLAAPLDAAWIAAGRVSLTAVVALWIARHALPTLGAALRGDRDLRLRIVLAGLLLGAHFGTWIASLSLTTVMKSVALVTTQPLFAAWFGRMLGDRVDARVWVGSAVAFVGAWIMTGASSDAVADGLGVGLALAGAAFAAAYLAVGRSVRDRVNVWSWFAVVNVVAALALLVYGVIVVGSPGANPAVGLAAVAWVAYLGIVPGVVGHGLLNWSVQRVPVHVVSLVAILETLGAAGLAWLVLDERPTGTELTGAVVLGLGVFMGVGRQAAPTTSDAPDSTDARGSPGTSDPADR